MFKAVFRRNLQLSERKQKGRTNLKILSGIYWDQGRRESNQDSIVLQQVQTNCGRVLLAVVCDGIGGLDQGENASGYVGERFMEIFYGELLPLIQRRKGRKAVLRSLLRCIYGTGEELRRYAAEREISLGTTMSLLLLWKKRYLILQLGDSRIYLYRGNRKRQLTKDHSDGGSHLTRCISSFPYQAPDVRFGRQQGKCAFLICTDGFYRKQDETGFSLLDPSKVDSGQQVQKRLEEMAKLALKRGEQDNLSAVYVKVC